MAGLLHGFLGIRLLKHGVRTVLGHNLVLVLGLRLSSAGNFSCHDHLISIIGHIAALSALIPGVLVRNGVDAG